jgi:omega-6 fatty acid desaturase (delta-12 desaturase)
LYLIGVEAINLPHHLQLPYHGGETKFHFWEQFKTARTCIYPRWIAQFIVLNFNYHIEHHLYPDAPWYYLKQIHQSIRPLLQGSYNLDSQFRWIIKAKQQSLDQVLFETQASEAEAKSA